MRSDEIAVHNRGIALSTCNGVTALHPIGMAPIDVPDHLSGRNQPETSQANRCCFSPNPAILRSGKSVLFEFHPDMIEPTFEDFWITSKWQHPVFMHHGLSFPRINRPADVKGEFGLTIFSQCAGPITILMLSRARSNR
jgi:hypothetical protein